MTTGGNTTVPSFVVRPVAKYLWCFMKKFRYPSTAPRRTRSSLLTSRSASPGPFPRFLYRTRYTTTPQSAAARGNCAAIFATSNGKLITLPRYPNWPPLGKLRTVKHAHTGDIIASSIGDICGHAFCSSANSARAASLVFVSIPNCASGLKFKSSELFQCIVSGCSQQKLQNSAFGPTPSPTPIATFFCRQFEQISIRSPSPSSSRKKCPSRCTGLTSPRAHGGGQCPFGWAFDAASRLSRRSPSSRSRKRSWRSCVSPSAPSTRTERSFSSSPSRQLNFFATHVKAFAAPFLTPLLIRSSRCCDRFSIPCSEFLMRSCLLLSTTTASHCRYASVAINGAPSSGLASPFKPNESPKSIAS